MFENQYNENFEIDSDDDLYDEEEDNYNIEFNRPLIKKTLQMKRNTFKHKTINNYGNKSLFDDN